MGVGGYFRVSLLFKITCEHFTEEITHRNFTLTDEDQWLEVGGKSKIYRDISPISILSASYRRFGRRLFSMFIIKHRSFFVVILVDFYRLF